MVWGWCANAACPKHVDLASVVPCEDVSCECVHQPHHWLRHRCRSNPAWADAGRRSTWRPLSLAIRQFLRLPEELTEQIGFTVCSACRTYVTATVDSRACGKRWLNDGPRCGHGTPGTYLMDKRGGVGSSTRAPSPVWCLVFIETTSDVFTIPSNKRHGIVAVQELRKRYNLFFLTSLRPWSLMIGQTILFFRKYHLKLEFFRYTK